ncbi:hypothetical protein [Ramlibacter pallidus]|uniref:DUF5076 domain-containing protein n=1 Tax=Ramlibacter pallidus TaxID=2780087 RepID=A0ABR9S798_9BURK|nr:hypothetical protein [Ramlibacter pallidus]MBE7369363.1 hypothetical protein [Ramlibacter pallidus]
MQTQHATPAAHATAAAGLASLEASDALLAPSSSPRYCPTGLLAGFALLMAGHGRCVNTDMMLGDREYAMWQLACARAMDDDELSQVATRLFSYFDDARQPSLPVMGTA